MKCLFRLGTILVPHLKTIFSRMAHVHIFVKISDRGVQKQVLMFTLTIERRK